MRIQKLLEEVAELFKGWLIYSPNVSRRSTSRRHPMGRYTYRGLQTSLEGVPQTQTLKARAPSSP